MDERQEVLDRRERLTCNVIDPCAYDNTCSNHKLLAYFEAQLADLQARLARAEEDSENLREPMACGHYEANLVPTDGPGEACIVCGEIANLRAEQREALLERLRASVLALFQQIAEIRGA